MISNKSIRVDKSIFRRAAVRVAASVLMVAGVCAVTATSAQAAGRVFSETWEAGNTDKWGSDGSRTRCTTVRSAVDSVAAHSGNYMLQCNWNGLVAWDNPDSFSVVTLKQWDYKREFLVRMWVRYASDVDHVRGNKLFRLYPGAPEGSFYVAGQMENAGGPMFVAWEMIANRQGPTSWGDGAPFGDGKWHRIEVYVKHNTDGQSDGVLRVWQDGVIKQQASNLVTAQSGMKWYPLYLMSNWSNNPGWEHDANNHVYWDDIEVYSDSGTGGSGQLSDASIKASDGPTPNPPTGLSVQ